MSWFYPCIHDWSVLVKSKTTTTENIIKCNFSSEETERLRFGVTTVLVNCKKCGKLERHEMLGQVEQ